MTLACAESDRKLEQFNTYASERENEHSRQLKKIEECSLARDAKHASVVHELKATKEAYLQSEKAHMEIVRQMETTTANASERDTETLQKLAKATQELEDYKLQHHNQMAELYSSSWRDIPSTEETKAQLEQYVAQIKTQKRDRNRLALRAKRYIQAVSYTHLTLPTNREV